VSNQPMLDQPIAIVALRRDDDSATAPDVKLP
jgi:hypothetical protein